MSYARTRVRQRRGLSKAELGHNKAEKRISYAYLWLWHTLLLWANKHGLETQQKFGK